MSHNHLAHQILVEAVSIGEGMEEFLGGVQLGQACLVQVMACSAQVRSPAQGN